MHRKYELVYIVSPEATDDQVTDLHTQVEAIVQRLNGQIEKTDNWGRRKLAYEIGRAKEGTYVLEVILGGGELMKEIDRRLKVSDLVIRHLIVRVDEEEGVVERKRARHYGQPLLSGQLLNDLVDIIFEASAVAAATELGLSGRAPDRRPGYEPARAHRGRRTRDVGAVRRGAGHATHVAAPAAQGFGI